MPLDLDDPSRTSGSADPHARVDVETHSGLTYRPLVTPEDAAACFDLQGHVWGSTFDRVPASLLRVTTKIGGLAIGAFDDRGVLVGFVYGLAGLRDRGGRHCFKPNRQVKALRFRLTIRGQQLAVEMEAGSVTYTLERGDGLTIYHIDERLDL